jgi:hypothetical protein
LPTFLLTAEVMVKRALKRRDMPWLCGLVPAIILVLTPSGGLSGRLISAAALLPAVFLLTGWADSKSRKGIVSLLYRTDGYGSVRASEIALPAVAGSVLSSLGALVSGRAIPWQFWLTVPLTAVSFSFLLSLTERKLRYAGRSMFGLLWIYGISRPVGTGGTVSALLFTDYPGGILFTLPDSGGLHPDYFVVASLFSALLSAGLVSFFTRGE